MTAKEKAQELYEAMFYKIPSEKLNTKEHDKAAIDCALVAVDKIIEEILSFDNSLKYYYTKVKEEINKI